MRAWALVDPEDVERLGHYAWRLATVGYARRFVQGVGRKGRGVVKGPGHYVFLHREVLGLAPSGRDVVDHINRDKLDCRKSNLRVGTQALNRQNMRGYGRSAHRGVSYDKSRDKWVAAAKIPGGQKKHLGRYATELEAAEAASAFRREHMPWAVED